jgi:hypothetical protein
MVETITLNTDQEYKTGPIQGKYELCASDRYSFLARAREAAALTIPSLLPKEGHTGSSILPTPFQSVGARGVNNLASKLLLSLLPPNAPFFRLVIDDAELEQMVESQKGAVEEALSKIERMVMQEIEVKAVRVPVFEALKQLIVSGNVLLYLPDKGQARVFRLDRYVCKRDAMGNVLEIITKETLSPLSLPEPAKQLVVNENNPMESVDLFTCVKWEGSKWTVYQEIGGEEVPGSRGTYKKGKCPFLPLRFTSVDSEDYGRGYVEEYIGDLKSLESLTQSIVEGSAAAAKVLFLVRPNGTTRLKSLADSPNGAIVMGDANDVSTLQLNKFNDFRVAQETIRSLTERLSYAFLNNSAVRRDAERVTAEEIRMAYQELETALGGVYSVLSQEFQLPLVSVLMNRMQKEKKLPKFPDESLKPMIVTGVEALGRGQDLNELAGFLQYLQPLGPEVVQQEINIPEYIDRLGASLGIDTEGLLKTEEQKQQEMQAQQQQQQEMMMQQTMAKAGERAAPEVVKAMKEGQMQQQAEG